MDIVKVIKLIDSYLGSIICLVLAPLKKNKSILINKPKTLFIQLWGIGESILTIPAIKLFQEDNSSFEVTILCTARNEKVYLLSGLNIKTIPLSMNPFKILKFIILNINAYDIVFDFEEYLNISTIISYFIGKKRVGFSHGIRSNLYNKRITYDDNLHCMETFNALVKPYLNKIKAPQLGCLICTPGGSKNIKKFTKTKNKDTLIIGFVPGAAESAKSRMWPKNRFAELGKLVLSKYDAKILLIGSLKEYELCEEIRTKIKSEQVINTAGKFDLEGLVCLIKSLDGIITNDTGPLHIASAENVPTIAFFGPNTPSRFGPLSKKRFAFYNQNSCKHSPCINVHKAQVPDCLFDKTSKSYKKCILSIKVSDVFLEFQNFFDSNQGAHILRK